MESKLLKIIEQLRQGQTESLTCEVPKAMIDDLNIQEDGTVDLATLLKICRRTAHIQDAESRSFEKHQDLMKLIFDPSIAVDPKS